MQPLRAKTSWLLITFAVALVPAGTAYATQLQVPVLLDPEGPVDPVPSPPEACDPCKFCGPIDTDGDGTPDTDDSDDDGDGMTDVYEMEVSKTHPQRPDSDGDGLSDTVEYLQALTSLKPLDPNNDDIDGDGWTDGYEDEHGTDHTDPDSNPTQPFRD